jgi:hypothetical protein
MNREQYGEHHFDRTKTWKESPNGKKYTSAGDFFWRYQVNQMYIRYFLWNFGGIADDDFSFDLKKFWFLPLFLGFLGAFYHFWKDWKNGLAVLVLFFMTGLAIILYLILSFLEGLEEWAGSAGTIFYDRPGNYPLSKPARSPAPRTGLQLCRIVLRFCDLGGDRHRQYSGISGNHIKRKWPPVTESADLVGGAGTISGGSHANAGKKLSLP